MFMFLPQERRAELRPAFSAQESHKKTSKRVYYCTIGLLLLGVVIVVLVDVRKKATGKNGHR